MWRSRRVSLRWSRSQSLMSLDLVNLAGSLASTPLTPTSAQRSPTSCPSQRLLALRSCQMMHSDRGFQLTNYIGSSSDCHLSPYSSSHRSPIPGMGSRFVMSRIFAIIMMMTRSPPGRTPLYWLRSPVDLQTLTGTSSCKDTSTITVLRTRDQFSVFRIWIVIQKLLKYTSTLRDSAFLHAMARISTLAKGHGSINTDKYM